MEQVYHNDRLIAEPTYSLQGDSNVPVEACLACAAWVGNNPIERQRCPSEPQGTRKACLYGDVRFHGAFWEYVSPLCSDSFGKSMMHIYDPGAISV